MSQNESHLEGLMLSIQFIANKVTIDLILYIILKAFTDMYLIAILLHQGLIHNQTSA